MCNIYSVCVINGALECKENYECAFYCKIQTIGSGKAFFQPKRNDIFLISTRKHVADTHKRRFTRALIISTHILFHGEIRKLFCGYPL